MALYTDLFDIIDDWAFPSISCTKYSEFYHVHTPKLGKSTKATCFQYRLELKRPLIDYIQLPDHSFLIGYSRDFEDMKKASLELTTQYLLDETKRHKKVCSKILSSLEHITKHAAPMAELTPEEFI